MMDLSKISQDDVGFYIERTEDRKGLAFYIYAKTDVGMKYLDAKDKGVFVYGVRKPSGKLVAWVQREDEAELISCALEMYKLLVEMDFVEAMCMDGDSICFCPICGSGGNGHNKNCRLDIILKKVEGII